LSNLLDGSEKTALFCFFIRLIFDKFFCVCETQTGVNRCHFIPMATPQTSKTLYFSVPLEMALRIETEANARGITKSALFLELFRAWEQWDRETRRRHGGEIPKNGKEKERCA
jgi:hypothetical protein